MFERLQPFTTVCLTAAPTSAREALDLRVAMRWISEQMNRYAAGRATTTCIERGYASAATLLRA
jgi:hypothetical protein